MTTLPLGLLQQAVGAPGGPSIGLKPRGPLSPSDVHVLVVDDEPISRHVVSSLLKCCHYKVTTADNGAEAMDLLRSSPPDTFQLVLTDVCMPEVDGIQLLQYVKQEENLRSVPVIMMSSIEQGSTVHDCVTYGAEEYLVKPVTRKEVVNMWQHVLRKQTASAMAVPQQQHAIAREIVTKDGGARSNQANQANQMNQANQNEIKMTKSIKPMRTDSADWKSAGHVLRLIHNAKHAEAARVAGQLAKVEADIGVMLQWKRSWQDQPSSGKRRRTTLSPTLEPHFRSIDDTYYSRRQRAEGCSHNDGDVPNMLVSLSKDLDILDRDPRFVKRATVRAEDTASPQEMVSLLFFSFFFLYFLSPLLYFYWSRHWTGKGDEPGGLEIANWRSLLRARNSVVECSLRMRKVAGSIPASSNFLNFYFRFFLIYFFWFHWFTFHYTSLLYYRYAARISMLMMRM